MSDAPPGALFFGAADRNKQPIADVLTGVLPSAGTVVELASGGGQHAAYMSGRFPHLTWQPTEPEAARRASIEAWRQHVNNPNLAAPLELDVQQPWPIDVADAIYACNLLHVSARSASSAVLSASARVLRVGAPLCIYGPFKRHGAFTTPSNAAFDVTVRGWHPSYGIRDLDELIVEAQGHDLHIDRIEEMPANNFLVVWRRGR
ncbi:MAG: DUF938 domain-containing protein [Proteobacteria bacterium]|nr:DUF938 domain-containing protein [Pseudomonadota bacterium]